MSVKFTCPRRSENGMDRTDGPFVGAGTNLDTWERRSGMAGSPLLPLCSYCGSLNPADLMDGLQRQRYILGPTDKSYKIYIHENDGSFMREGDLQFPDGKTIAKFYTKHLSNDQAWMFHMLWQAGHLQFSYPGHFYRPIYLPGVVERLKAAEIDG